MANENDKAAQTFDEWWKLNRSALDYDTRAYLAMAAWNAALRTRPVIDDAIVERIAQRIEREHFNAIRYAVSKMCQLLITAAKEQREQEHRKDAEIAVLSAFVKTITNPTPQPSVVGGSYPSTDCPIYGGRRRGWTCLDEQAWASDETHPYGDELRAALVRGDGLCLRCRATQLLDRNATHCAGNEDECKVPHRELDRMLSRIAEASRPRPADPQLRERVGDLLRREFGVLLRLTEQQWDRISREICALGDAPKAQEP